VGRGQISCTTCNSSGHITQHINDRIDHVRCHNCHGKFVSYVCVGVFFLKFSSLKAPVHLTALDAEVEDIYNARNVMVQQN
jgi:hypothetical protein